MAAIERWPHCTNSGFTVMNFSCIIYCNFENQPFFSAVIVDEGQSFLTLAVSLAVGGVIVIVVAIAIVIGAIVYYKK